MQDIPAQIYAGDSLTINHYDADFPPDLWTLAVFLTGNAAEVAMTEEGSGYTGTLTAAQSASLLGPYQLLYVFTKDGERQTRPGKTLTVLANPTATATASFASQALASVESAILRLSTGTNASVNINGQQFTKKDMTQLYSLRTQLQAEVLRERNAAAGRGSGTNIQAKFVRLC